MKSMSPKLTDEISLLNSANYVALERISYLYCL